MTSQQNKMSTDSIQLPEIQVESLNPFDDQQASTSSEEDAFEIGTEAHNFRYKPRSGMGDRLFPQVAAAATNFSDDFRMAANSTRAATTAITDLANHVRNLVSQIPPLASMAEKLVTGIVLIYDVIIAFWKRVWFSIPSLIVRLLQLFDLDKLLIQHFVHDVVQHQVSYQPEQGPRVVQAQARDFDSLWVKCIGLITLRRAPTINEMKYVNEFCRLKDSTMKGVKDIDGLVSSVIRSLPDTLQAWLQYLVPAKWWAHAIAPGTEFYQWIDAVNSLDSHEYKSRAAYDVDIQRRVRDLYIEGQKHLKMCTEMGPKMSSIYRLLEKVFVKIDTLWKVVDISGLQRTQRQVPFAIYLYGATGQGKSFIAGLLPKILLDAPNELNLSYSRNHSAQFWDGYTGQACVQYDDFFASRNSNVVPGECAELMTIVSNQVMQLNMAALPDKGEVFRSRIVIMTSNSTHPRPNDITDHQALWRRRHVFVEVALKPEFRNAAGQLNPEMARGVVDGSMWQFRYLPKLEDRDVFALAGPWIEWAQFVRDTKEAYDQHFFNQGLALENARTMADNMVEPRVVQAQGLGLADAFRAAFIDNQETEPSPETVNLLQQIQILETKMEKDTEWNKWKAILGFVGILSASIAAFFIIRSMQDRQQYHEQCLVNLSYRIDDVVPLLTALQEAKARQIDSEGRWNRLYQDIRHSISPEQWSSIAEAMSDEMDKGPFGELTDEEVEETINATLKNPRVRKFLRTEGVYAGTHGKLPHNVRVMQKPTPIRVEAGIDKNAIEITAKRLIPNLCQVNCHGYAVNGIMVGGRTLLTVGHIFKFGFHGQWPPEGTPFSIIWRDAEFNDIFQRSRLVFYEPDIAFYDLNENIPGIKDISRHFILHEDISFSEKFDCVMTYQVEDGTPILAYASSPAVLSEEDLCYTANGAHRENLDFSRLQSLSLKPGTIHTKKAHHWRVTVPTVRGTCGGMLVKLDKFAARKIAGLHFGGDDEGVGYSYPITQEMIVEARQMWRKEPLVMNLTEEYERCRVVDTEGCLLDLDKVSRAHVQIEGNFTKFGTLKIPIYINETTKIRPSLVSGKIFDVVTGPSVLSPADPRAVCDISPLKLGVEKYGRSAPVMDQRTLAIIVQHLVRQFKSWSNGMEYRVWTEHEALNGIEGVEFADPVNTDTSPGFPYYNIKRTGKGKLGFLKGNLIERTLEVDCDLLRKNIDERLDLAKNGERTESFWIDMLKDERRKLGKVLSSSTRVFTIPPFDYLIVARQYFYSFVVNFYQNRLKFFSAVGIDPMSMEWTTMFNKLKNNSLTGFAGDYKGWDGNLAPQAMDAFGLIVDAMYEDATSEDRRVRKVIIEESIHTKQIAMDMVYQTHLGNPSGMPFTTIINTVVDGIYIRYAWMKLAPLRLQSMEEFDKHVVDFEYGDDIILSIKEEVQDWFNPEGIGMIFEDLHMSFTAATKVGKATIVPIERLSFLKRGFRQDEKGMWLPTIDIQTMTELVNWIREIKGETPEDATIDNINSSLEFAFGWGRKFYDQFEKKILEGTPPKWHSRFKSWNHWYVAFWGKQVGAPRCIQSQASAITATVDAAMTTITSQLPTPGPNVIGSAPPEDDDVRTKINTVGAMSEGSRMMETSGPTLAPISTPKMDARAISDHEWTMADTVHRSTPVGTYQWTTSQTPSTTIIKYELPTDMITGYLQGMAPSHFLYYKGPIRVTIRLNGMRQMQGRLMAYFVPFVRKEVTGDWHEKYLQCATSLNPVFMSPSTNNEVTVTVPYYNPKTFVNINGPIDPDLDFTGTFIISVLAQLRCADCASTHVDVSVWASFGQETKFRIPAHAATAFTYDQRVSRRVRVIQSQGNTVSNTTNQSFNAMGNIDSGTIQPNLKGDDFSGAASGNEITALDRAPRSWNPFGIYRKAVQFFTHWHGTETVCRLDVSGANMTTVTREHFSTNEDEMKMAFLLQRPTYFRTVTWSATATNGTRLLQCFIGPMCSMFVTSGGTTTQIPITTAYQQLPLTLWEFNCTRFKFWRGGMRIRIDFIASQFHTGKLMLSVNYGAAPEVETTLQDASSQYYEIINIDNEKQFFEFDIPYKAATEVLEVCRGPANVSDLGGFARWWPNYFCGSFSLIVQNQLQTTCSTPPDIDLVMFVSGSPDFKVIEPAATNRDIQALSVFKASPVRVIQAHATKKSEGAMGGEDAVQVGPLMPAYHKKAPAIQPADAGQTVHDDDKFGIRAVVTTCRDFIRRYCRIQNGFATPIPQVNTGPTSSLETYRGYIALTDTSYTNISVGVYNFIPVRPVDAHLDHNVSGTPYYWNEDGAEPLYHYGSQYRAWIGGLRYKIICGNIMDGDGNLQTPLAYHAMHIPHSRYAGDTNASGNFAQLFLTLCAASGGAPVTNTYSGTAIASHMAIPGIDPVLEVEVPFMTRMNWMPTLNGVFGDENSSTLLENGFLLVYTTFLTTSTKYNAWVTAGSSVLCDVRALVSVGDDYRMGIFGGMPIVAYANTVSSQWPSTWVFTSTIERPVRPKVSRLPTSSQMTDMIHDAMDDEHYEIIRKPKVRVIQAQGANNTIMHNVANRCLTNARLVSDWRSPLALFRTRSYTGAQPLFNISDVADIVAGKPVLVNTRSASMLRMQEAYLEFWLAEEGNISDHMFVDRKTNFEVVENFIDNYDFVLDSYIGQQSVAFEFTTKLDDHFRGTFTVPKFTVPREKFAQINNESGPPCYISLDQVDLEFLKALFTALRQWTAMLREPNYKEEPLTVDPDVVQFQTAAARHNIEATKEYTSIDLSGTEVRVRVVQSQARKQIEPHDREAYGNLERQTPTTTNLKKAICLAYTKMSEGDLNGRMALNDIKTQIETVNILYEVTQSGPSHTPIFTCKCSFSVNNPAFDKKFGKGEGITKKECEERSARDLMTVLHAIQLTLHLLVDDDDFLDMLRDYHDNPLEFIERIQDVNSNIRKYFKQKNLDFAVVASQNKKCAYSCRVKIALKDVISGDKWRTTVHYTCGDPAEDTGYGLAIAIRSVLLKYAYKEKLIGEDWENTTLVNTTAPSRALVLEVAAQAE